MLLNHTNFYETFGERFDGFKGKGRERKFFTSDVIVYSFPRWRDARLVNVWRMRATSKHNARSATLIVVPYRRQLGEIGPVRRRVYTQFSRVRQSLGRPRAGMIHATPLRRV